MTAPRIAVTDGRDLDAAFAARDRLAAEEAERELAAGLGAALAGHVCLTCGRGRNVCRCTDGPTLERPVRPGPSDAELAAVFDVYYDEAEEAGATAAEAGRYALAAMDRHRRGDVPPELEEGAPLSPCCGLPVPFHPTSGACDTCDDRNPRSYP